MSFNHRVIRRRHGEAELFTIHEVYYRDGQIIEAWTGEVSPAGESLEELRRELEYFRRALDQPVLDWEEMPGPGELSERGKAVEG